MDSFETNPDENLQVALRGSRRLRRGLSGLSEARRTEIASALGDTDATRFKGLYRDRLKQVMEYERDAAPTMQRRAIEEGLKTPGLDSSTRERLDGLLRKNKGGYGTIGASADPYRYGSIASSTFGSLYRR
jgi:hypothetical protein